MNINFVNLFIIVLGVWRVTSLFTNEGGPFNIFRRLRDVVWDLDQRHEFLHSFHLFEGYTCEWCFGLWLSLLFVPLWYFVGDTLLTLLLPFTISAGVIAMKYIVQGLEQWKKSLGG